MTTNQLVGEMARNRSGWNPAKLRESRELHGLTLEAAGEQLRQTARKAGLTAPAANFQTLWQHEQGEIYPGPHYRRAYCLLYRSTEPELGFRRALPGEVNGTPTAYADDDRARVATLAATLSRLLPENRDDGFPPIAERVLDAWRTRGHGPTSGRPLLVLVGGFAGSGKSEVARFLAQLTGWALLDKDPLCRPLVEHLLTELGCDPNDRHSETYRREVRPLEYQCLMESIYLNIDNGLSTVATAPSVAELTDPAWTQRLANRCQAHQVDLCPLWITCDEDSMREYIGFRSAARDA
ncbi:AAA family ATPase [Streptomyces sp. NPDC058459]|uniref:AAA family ATPase n=1 Tax=Streptomyces sp. NPDC058459 TaxID=3346508 RepID=UPI003647CF7C